MDQPLGLLETTGYTPAMVALDVMAKASPLAKNEPQVAEATANMKAKQATLDKAREDLLKRPQQMEAWCTPCSPIRWILNGAEFSLTRLRMICGLLSTSGSDRLRVANGRMCS